MNPRKAFAAAVSCSVLGLQVAAMLPPGRTAGSWYWPFQDYPMYSHAQYPGDVFSLRELRGKRCAPSGEVEILGDAELRVMRFKFFALLDQVAAPAAAESSGAGASSAADPAVEQLSKLIRTHAPQRYCSAAVWERTVTIQAHPQDYRAVPWKLLREWELEPDPALDSR